MQAVMFIYNSLCIFNHVIDPDFSVDFTLLSGFLSAIDTFVAEVGNQTLNKIDLGNYRIFYFKKPLIKGNNSEEITLIMFVDKSESEKKIQKNLELLMNSFLEIYTPEDIIDWDGNVMKFFHFKRIINKITDPGNENQEILSEEEMLNIKGLDSEYDEISSGLISPEMVPFILDLKNQEKNTIQCIFNKIKSDVHYTFKTNSNFSKWSAFIPILNMDKIVYAYVEKFNDNLIANWKSGEKNESEKLIFILFFIPNKFQLIFPKLIDRFNGKIDALNKDLRDGNQNFSSLQDFGKYLNEFFSNSTVLKETLDETEIMPQNLDILEKKSLKHLDQVVHAIIINKPLAIIGDLEESRYLINQLQIFSPHKLLRIEEFPEFGAELPPNSVDILIIDEKNMKNYKSFVQLNLKKNSVKNGESNEFCTKLLDKIRDLNDSTLIINYLKKEINYLLSKSSLILNLSWGNISKKNINEIRADLSPDAEKIVLKFVEEKGTRLQNLVDKLSGNLPLNMLILDENFIQFNDNKILVSSKLPNDKINEYFEKIKKIGTNFLGQRFIEEQINSI